MGELPSGPGSRLALFLIEHLPASGMTNEEIASELGYARPNIVSAWKKGSSKFTLDHVFRMAEMLEVDPSYMLALYIDQYVSENDGVDRFDQIAKTLTRLCTDDEWELIKLVRDARRNNSMPLTDSQRDAVKSIFSVPITTAEGPYEPFDVIVPKAGERKRFKRRGIVREDKVREMSVTETEDAAASTDRKPGTTRKRSAAAKPADPEVVHENETAQEPAN